MVNLEKVVANLVQKVERRFYGKHRGLVVDNADPEKLGRLKLKVPSVLGGDVVTGWAMPCVPYGGDVNQGMLFIPEVGAGVWVEFEEGDLEFPIWVGTFWSKPGGDNELPHSNAADGSDAGDVQDPPTRKIIKTLKGHTIQFEDKDGEDLVMVMEATNGHVISMNKDGITISEASGNVIEMTKDGTKVTDANSNVIEMTPKGTKITDGVNSGNQISMEASGVTVQTSANKVILGSSGIQVGSDSATEPFVLGNQFMANVTSFLIALSTHTHVGNLGAPTSPPVAPMNLQVPLSMKHKVE
jgi:uncharacterized protein involved in type VI secretion and phage assembly